MSETDFAAFEGKNPGDRTIMHVLYGLHTLAPFTMLTLSVVALIVTNAGTLYSEQVPPIITASGGGGQKYQNPILLPVMTATQTDLSLNPGGKVIVATHTPSSASATGSAGMIAWDSSYIYVATGTNTWKRAAIATW